MSSRKFYKTTYVVEVLSEEPIPDALDLKDVMVEAETGSYSADVKSQETVEVDGPEMAKLLTGQRSEPAFFGLSADGEDEPDEWDKEDTSDDA